MERTILQGGFRYCNFTSTRFYEARFNHAQFVNCKFNLAFLYGARFDNCRFTKCSFEGTKFYQAKGLSTCFFSDDCSGMHDLVEAIATLNIKEKRYIVLPKYSLSSVTKRDNFKQKKMPLVDPKPLPPVKHYRSAPFKITESELDGGGYDSEDEEIWGPMCMYGASYYTENKNKWGYGKNVVLECSNIEEYTKKIC